MAAAKTVIGLNVHSVAPGKFAAQGNVAGLGLIDVEVPGLIVELISPDGSMSQTLRLVGDNAAPFEGAEEGDSVTATYIVNAE